MQEETASQTMVAKLCLAAAHEASVAAEDIGAADLQMHHQGEVVKTEQLRGNDISSLFQAMQTHSIQTPLGQGITGVNLGRVLCWTGFTLNAVTVALIPLDFGASALTVNIALGSASASVATARIALDSITDSLNAGSVVLSVVEIAAGAAGVGAIVGDVVGMPGAAAADVIGSADRIGEASAAVSIMYDSVQQC